METKMKSQSDEGDHEALVANKLAESFINTCQDRGFSPTIAGAAGILIAVEALRASAPADPTMPEAERLQRGRDHLVEMLDALLAPAPEKT